jgi:hypothetical protein
VELTEAGVAEAIQRSRQELGYHYAVLVAGDFRLGSRRETLTALREVKWELAELVELQRSLSGQRSAEE